MRLLLLQSEGTTRCSHNIHNLYFKSTLYRRVGIGTMACMFLMDEEVFGKEEDPRQPPDDDDDEYDVVFSFERPSTPGRDPRLSRLFQSTTSAFFPRSRKDDRAS